MSIVKYANAHSTYINKVYATHSKHSEEKQSFGQLSGFSDSSVKSGDSEIPFLNSAPIKINPTCLYKIEQKIFLRQQRHMEQLREAYEMFMPGATPPESFAELTCFHHTLMAFATGTAFFAGGSVQRIVTERVGIVAFRGNPWEGFKHLEHEALDWAVGLTILDRQFSSDSVKQIINGNAGAAGWSEEEFDFLYTFANNANRHRREIADANFRLAVESLASHEAKQAVRLISSGEHVSQEALNNLVNSFKNVMFQLVEQAKLHLAERDYDLFCEGVRHMLQRGYRLDGLNEFAREIELGITIGDATFSTWGEFDSVVRPGRVFNLLMWDALLL